MVIKGKRRLEVLGKKVLTACHREERKKDGLTGGWGRICKKKAS
jgi:hypothetical protein